MRVVVQGGGEMGSAAARLLFLCGFSVVVLERKAPLAVRRRVAFADAIPSGEAQVEGVTARLISLVEAVRISSDAARTPHSFLPVVVDEGAAVGDLAPRVLVDARMAKRNLGVDRSLAELVVGLGPGFEAGVDVHAVVETQRGPDLGRVLLLGTAEADSRVPSPVLGITEKRVLRSPATGAFVARSAIGDLVVAGQALAQVGGLTITAEIPGLVRGLLADGVWVVSGTKVGDIDPRGGVVDPARISDKARAIAAGVLEAVLLHLRP